MWKIKQDIDTGLFHAKMLPPYVFVEAMSLLKQGWDQSFFVYF